MTVDMLVPVNVRRGSASRRSLRWRRASWPWPLRGCSPRAAARGRREAGLDVLLITVDTLRADALGACRNARARTPWIDRLAAQGVRFEQAHAHNVVTLPSHANILSGRYPFQHGVRDNAGFRFPERAATLATRLKLRGYRTGAFVSAFPLDSRFGLDRGFEAYDDSFADGKAAVEFLLPERPPPPPWRPRASGCARATGGRPSPGSTCTTRTRPTSLPTVRVRVPARPVPARWRRRMRPSRRCWSRCSTPAPRGARSWCSRPTTASRWASTARSRTGSSPTRPRCASRWCSTRPACCRPRW